MFFSFCIVQCVLKKNGNETDPDLVLIVGVLSYAVFTGFQNGSF